MDFIWNEFCDWYIEIVKPRLYNKEGETRKTAQYVLNKVLSDSLKLLHPFMPFVTEKIYKELYNRCWLNKSRRKEVYVMSALKDYRKKEAKSLLIEASFNKGLKIQLDNKVIGG